MKWIKSLFPGVGVSSPGRNGSTEADAVFDKLYRFLNDEQARNNQLPDAIRLLVERGEDCDEVPGAIGEFGRTFGDPVPVNGPIGEIQYLSNLRTRDRTPIMFHRLGSMKRADAFETVSLDGKVWDILFLQMYHPRKSRRAPAGYSIAPEEGRQIEFLGTSAFVRSFPMDIQDAARDAAQNLVGIPMRAPELKRALEQVSFSRPTQHQDRLLATRSKLEGTIL